MVASLEAQFPNRLAISPTRHLLLPDMPFGQSIKAKDEGGGAAGYLEIGLAKLAS